MGKRVYLIIPDLHLGNVKAANRKNYRAEVEYVESELLKIAIKYRKQSYNVVALLLGDIFHNSYSDVTTALIDKDFLDLWQKKIGQLYTVVGNHELSYYKANPFYTAIRTIDSERLQRVMNKVWMPLGTSNTLNVVDRLDDGEVHFYFNHFGTGIQLPDEIGVNIGLFHQDVLDPEIKSATSHNGINLDYVKATSVEKSGILDGYQYCYFGHLHTVYGVWKANETFLVYLGSLGRPNETEVRDDLLERNIPGVIIDDGTFVKIEDNFIQLMSREECIFEDVVTKMQQKSQDTKEITEARNYVPLGDDPVKNILVRFAENPGIVGLVNDLAYSEYDTRYVELERKMRKLGVRNK